MNQFTAEQVTAALELQQLIVSYCRDLDHGGLNATEFFAEDGVVDVGRMSIKGHAAMKEFYESLAEHVRKETPGGVRVARHVCTNLHFSIVDDEATVTGLVTNYSGAGKPPLANATLPSIVSDVEFQCRRGVDRRWLICRLHGSPVFVGNDPVQNRTLIHAS